MVSIYQKRFSQIPHYSRKSADLADYQRNEYLVPSYKVNDEGNTECVPVVERLKTFPQDGKSLEIVNLMYGKLPEDLVQIEVQDPMERAERITSACVRRFGDLQKQRDAIAANYEQKIDIEE